MNGSSVILYVLLWSIQPSAGEQDVQSKTESDCQANLNGTHAARGSQYLQRGRVRAGVALEAEGEEEEKAKLCACAPASPSPTSGMQTMGMMGWTSSYKDMSIENGIGSCSDNNDFRFSGWYKNGGAGPQQTCEEGCTAADDCVGYEYESSGGGRCMLRYDEKAATTMKQTGPQGYSQELVQPAKGEVTGTDEWANATCYVKIPTGDNVGDCDCATATTTTSTALPMTKNTISEPKQYYIEDGCMKTQQYYTRDPERYNEKWRAKLTDASEEVAHVRCCDDTVINGGMSSMPDTSMLAINASADKEVQSARPKRSASAKPGNIWTPCVSLWPADGDKALKADEQSPDSQGVTGKQCPKMVSWYKAKELCGRIGLRLCTVAEIQTNFCCGSGCQRDQSVVWTSDSTTTTTTPQFRTVIKGVSDICKNSNSYSETLAGAPSPVELKNVDMQTFPGAVVCCYEYHRNGYRMPDTGCINRFHNSQLPKLPASSPIKKGANDGKLVATVFEQCTWETNYGAAENQCKRNGMTLCTKSQLSGDFCCNAMATGCTGTKAGFKNGKGRVNGKEYAHTFADRWTWVAADPNKIYQPSGSAAT
jgi:hypothetical protein